MFRLFPVILLCSSSKWLLLLEETTGRITLALQLEHHPSNVWVLYILGLNKSLSCSPSTLPSSLTLLSEAFFFSVSPFILILYSSLMSNPHISQTFRSLFPQHCAITDSSFPTMKNSIPPFYSFFQIILRNSHYFISLWTHTYTNAPTDHFFPSFCL